MKADPIEAITPDIPDVKPTDPDDSDIVAEITYRGILTFEDLWPYRGDFDMNDVVVEYESTVGYNRANEVLRTIDNIRYCGLELVMITALLINWRHYAERWKWRFLRLWAEMEGAFVDPEVDRATIRLANNVRAYANEDEKVTFKVVTKYTGRKINKEDFVLPPYNPLSRQIH